MSANSTTTINAKTIEITGKPSTWAKTELYNSSLTMEASETYTNKRQMNVFGSTATVKGKTINQTNSVLADGSMATPSSTVTFIASEKANINELTAYKEGTQIQVKAPDLTLQLSDSGKLLATEGGKIDLEADKADVKAYTVLTKANKNGKGVINFHFGAGSQWKLTKDSELTTLAMDNGTIDLSRWSFDSYSHKGVYRTLTTDTFTGNGNTLKFGINWDNESADQKLTDQLIVNGAATGQHKALIEITASNAPDPNKWYSHNWLISQGDGSDMKITNAVDGTNRYSANGTLSVWSLAFIGQDKQDALQDYNKLLGLTADPTGIGAGQWYLVRVDDNKIPQPDPKPDPKPDPDPEPGPVPTPDPDPEPQPGPGPTPQPPVDDPAEMQQITNLGISSMQAMSFASELEDLRTRLGEVRYGAKDGAWVRAGYAKERADGFNGRGFKQKTQDLHIGVDRLVATDAFSSWLVGGALRYAKSDQEGYAAACGGTGELEQYSAKLYATYMRNQGSYADFVLQVGRYSQDISGMANDKMSNFTADYDTMGYGASVEVGHTYSFGQQNPMNQRFIEPQLQLSYFKANGKDYRTSTGMEVSQGDADFLTGRAGMVMGQTFHYGADNRYFQVALKGGMKYEFKGDQSIRFSDWQGVTKTREADEMDGARYYYGVTGNWQVDETLRAYATLEREEGDNYTKDFHVTVGVKYRF